MAGGQLATGALWHATFNNKSTAAQHWLLFCIYIVHIHYPYTHVCRCVRSLNWSLLFGGVLVCENVSTAAAFCSLCAQAPITCNVASLPALPFSLSPIVSLTVVHFITNTLAAIMPLVAQPVGALGNLSIPAIKLSSHSPFAFAASTFLCYLHFNGLLLQWLDFAAFRFSFTSPPLNWSCVVWCCGCCAPLACPLLLCISLFSWNFFFTTLFLLKLLPIFLLHLQIC